MLDMMKNMLTTVSGGYWEQLKAVICLISAVACGIGIFIVFTITHRKISVNRGFALTLIMLSPVAAMVAVIISYDIVIAVGMLGALSIIRFRHSMKEARNLVFVFWSVTAGLACGLKYFDIAAIGCVIIAAIVLFVHCLVNRETYGMLSIKYLKADMTTEKIEATLNASGIPYNLKYTSMTDDSKADALYEIKMTKRNDLMIKKDIYNSIARLKGISSVKLIEM